MGRNLVHENTRRLTAAFPSGLWNWTSLSLRRVDIADTGLMRARRQSSRNDIRASGFVHLPFTINGRLHKVAVKQDPPEPVRDAEFKTALRKAKRGDVDAMYFVALRYGAVGNTGQMLNWLKFASELGNGKASYKLYRHYNLERRDLVDAIMYRSRAKRQGYVSPPGVRVDR